MKKKVFNPVAQRAVLTKYIRMAMVRKDIHQDKDLAVMLGLSRTALSNRLNHGGWKDAELWQVFRVLEFSAEEIVIAMGGVV